MFGYVVMNKPEIRFKDFDLYRSFYCGLCRELREKYGISGQITLTYDMTFVVVLLSALYEPPTQKGTTRCVIHPVCKQPVRKNAATEYGADMNVLLTYYKCMDDWEDEKKFAALGYGKILQRKNNQLSYRYPEKAEKIRKLLEELSQMEKAGETDIDKMSGCFGRIMEEIFAWKTDVWEGSLRRMGFYLGKFIYIMDAYEDLPKDIEKHSYNPLKEMVKEDGYEARCKEILFMMMGECAAAFEQLPCIQNIDILRNILYDGVWKRYQKLQEKSALEKSEEE